MMAVVNDRLPSIKSGVSDLALRLWMLISKGNYAEPLWLTKYRWGTKK